MGDHREDHADRHQFKGPDEIDVRKIARGGTPGVGKYLDSDGTWSTPAGGTGGGLTVEDAQDAVGQIFTDTATIDFTYDDATPKITADVKASSIGPNELASTAVTPGTYGSTTQSAVIAVDPDGRIVSASNATITGAGGGGDTLWAESAGSLYPVDHTGDININMNGNAWFGGELATNLGVKVGFADVVLSGTPLGVVSGRVPIYDGFGVVIGYVPLYDGTTATPSELNAHLVDTVDAHDASAISVIPFSSIAATNVQSALQEIVAEATGGGNGAPTSAQYLVAVADGGLSAEIVVGTTPGGELGGTWASPTVDASHSGSTHAAIQAAAEATAASNLGAHTNDALDAHPASAIGFSPTGTIASTNVQAAIAEVAAEAVGSGGPPSGLAGGALSGTYPNPAYHINTPGNGLTMSNNILNVGAGAGIQVNADTVEVLYGTTANTACAGNDSRLTGGGGGPPTGTAGGVLSGTYPNPGFNVALAGPGLTVANNILSVGQGTGVTVAADTVSVNYGSASSTACEGNDARLSNSRAPNGSAGGALSGTYPNPNLAPSVAGTGLTLTGNVLSVTGGGGGGGQTTAAAVLETSESSNVGSYTDLNTVGPAVTITTGTTALVRLTCNVQPGQVPGFAIMGFAISGATTLAEADNRCLRMSFLTTAGATNQQRASAEVYVTGLTAGSNVFTAKYKTNGTQTMTFSSRTISVTAL